VIGIHLSLTEGSGEPPSSSMVLGLQGTSLDTEDGRLLLDLAHFLLIFLASLKPRDVKLKKTCLLRFESV
jgi:hypothetical protein